MSYDGDYDGGYEQSYGGDEYYNRDYYGDEEFYEGSGDEGYYDDGASRYSHGGYQGHGGGAGAYNHGFNAVYETVNPSVTCFNCGVRGHYANECRVPRHREPRQYESPVRAAPNNASQRMGASGYHGNRQSQYNDYDDNYDDDYYDDYVDCEPLDEDERPLTVLPFGTRLPCDDSGFITWDCAVATHVSHVAHIRDAVDTRGATLTLPGRENRFNQRHDNKFDGLRLLYFSLRDPCGPNAREWEVAHLKEDLYCSGYGHKTTRYGGVRVRSYVADLLDAYGKGQPLAFYEGETVFHHRGQSVNEIVHSLLVAPRSRAIDVRLKGKGFTPYNIRKPCSDSRPFSYNYQRRRFSLCMATRPPDYLDQRVYFWEHFELCFYVDQPLVLELSWEGSFLSPHARIDHVPHAANYCHAVKMQRLERPDAQDCRETDAMAEALVAELAARARRAPPPPALAPAAAPPAAVVPPTPRLPPPPAVARQGNAAAPRVGEKRGRVSPPPVDAKRRAPAPIQAPPPPPPSASSVRRPPVSAPAQHPSDLQPPPLAPLDEYDLIDDDGLDGIDCTPPCAAAHSLTTHGSNASAASAGYAVSHHRPSESDFDDIDDAVFANVDCTSPLRAAERARPLHIHVQVEEVVDHQLAMMHCTF